MVSEKLLPRAPLASFARLQFQFPRLANQVMAETVVRLLANKPVAFLFVEVAAISPEKRFAPDQ